MRGPQMTITQDLLVSQKDFPTLRLVGGWSCELQQVQSRSLPHLLSSAKTHSTFCPPWLPSLAPEMLGRPDGSSQGTGGRACLWEVRAGGSPWDSPPQWMVNHLFIKDAPHSGTLGVRLTLLCPFFFSPMASEDQLEASKALSRLSTLSFPKAQGLAAGAPNTPTLCLIRPVLAEPQLSQGRQLPLYSFCPGLSPSILQ